MKKQDIKKFKQRWAKINKVEDDELRKLSTRDKFYQFNSIMRLARGMRADFSEDQEKRNVRSRWIFLKKGST